MKKTTLNFENLRYHYHSLNRQKKGKLLDKLCDLHGYNRKYLLQILNHLNHKKSPRSGSPPNQYNAPGLFDILKTIWLISVRGLTVINSVNY